MAPKSKRKAHKQGRGHKPVQTLPTAYPPKNAGSEEAGRAVDFSEVQRELSDDELEARESLEALPVRRQNFVLHYCSNGFRGAQAARDAGYSERTARSIAHELLTKPDVKAAVHARMKLIHMDADEVTARMSLMARADISPYLYWHEETGRIGLKLDELRADGLGFLIKEIWDTPEGTRVKLHDAQWALEKIARMNGQLKEQVEHSGMLVSVNAEDVTKARAAVTDWEKQRFGSDSGDAASMGESE